VFGSLLEGIVETLLPFSVELEIETVFTGAGLAITVTGTDKAPIKIPAARVDAIVFLNFTEKILQTTYI